MDKILEEEEKYPMKCIVDTSVLMSGATFSQYEMVAVPIVVLEEIDDLCKSSDREKAHKARRAQGIINNLINDKKFQTATTAELEESFPRFLSSHKNDNIIIACAKAVQSEDPDYILLTQDSNMFHKATLCQVFCYRVTLNNEDVYTGYIKITGTTEEINEKFSDLSYTDMYPNQYIIIEDLSTNKTKEMKWDGQDLVKLKLPPSSYVKAKNSLQRCALDMLIDPNITACCILGDYGSGKTYLSMQSALYMLEKYTNIDKILGVREPVGNGKDIGYLKGTFHDKTIPFFNPLRQQMTDYQFDAMLNLKQIETQIPRYMKGTTYNNTVIIADEAEDLTESQLVLLGTRVGENSKIMFVGDQNQSLLDKTIDNPLVRLCNELKGDTHFACIFLDEDVRSYTSKMFTKVFKN